MIGSLKGCITAVYAPFILLEVAGVGYEIETPMNTFCMLKKDDELFLWTHLVVREDAQLLYGFTSHSERSIFRTLIKVNGVGAKMAIALLSSIDIHSLKRAVATDDFQRLVKVPGVGKKTAERLIIELRGKLDHISSDDSGSDEFSLESGNSDTNEKLVIESEAIAALQSLGYSAKDSEKTINAVKDQCNTIQDFIRLGLKHLSG